jgi:nucleoside-diphosphate-sugar epimerase
MNVCQAALESGVQRVVHTSTSEVYGTAKYVPIDESHPLQPQSPYSATKIGADAIAMSYHHAFQLPVAVARPFNTYGPRQSARAVIPTIISQLAAGAETVRLGDLRPRRDFNFVEDTCAGLLAIGSADGTVGDVFNIGSGTDVSVGDVFELIRGLMGSTATIETEDIRMRPETSEVFRLLCDCSKLATATGYQPTVSLEEGLGRTIEWFTSPENLRKYKTDAYVV